MFKKVITIDKKRESSNVCKTKKVTKYYFFGICVLCSINIEHFIEPSPSPLIHRDWKEPIPVKIAL